MLQKRLVILLTIGFLFGVTHAHEPGDMMIGSNIFQFVFMSVAILFISLLLSAGVEHVCANKNTRYLLYGVIALCALGGIVYIGYHYLIH